MSNPDPPEEIEALKDALLAARRHFRLAVEKLAEATGRPPHVLEVELLIEVNTQNGGKNE